MAQANAEAQAAAPRSAADDSAAPVQTVLVTSRKFSERLVDVPIAISVFSNADLTRRGTKNVVDALQSVPGVSAYESGVGMSTISIRGVSTTLGGNPNGYYLDDLPFTGVSVPLSPNVQTWDLDRIEVLRGPQGTLFGEGSMGGTIRTLTNNARLNTFSFAGETGLSHTEGGGDNRSVKAMLNVPLIDNMLAVRVALTDDHAPGWIDNPAEGRNNVNKSDIDSQRVRVLFKPTDALTVNGTYWRYRSDYPTGRNETDAGTLSQSSILSSESNYTLKGLNGTYDFDAFSVFYGYAENQFSLPQMGQVGGGLFDASINVKVKSHELRVSSSATKPWRWTGGLYRRTAQRVDNVLYEAYAFQQVATIDDKAEAAFGEVTYTFPNMPLEATLGMRHVRNTISEYDVTTDSPDATTGGKFNSNNPRFSLAYRPTENQQIYASASKGFRSGQNQITGLDAVAAANGVTLPSSIKPDSIWTYELGTKLSALERRLSMEFAVYHSNWKDFAVAIPIGNTGLSGLISSTGTKTNGLDASFAYAVTPAFSATLNGGWVDAKYTGSVPGTIIVDGTRVGNVPIFTGSVGGEYRFAVGGGWKGLALASLQHAGSHPRSTSATQTAGDTIDNINARLAFSKGDWTVSLFGENLGNDHGATTYRSTYTLDNGSRETVAPRLRPRTIGLELRYAMGK
jgi:outer membrane receptor protein involved in Fe transport